LNSFCVGNREVNGQGTFRERGDEVVDFSVFAGFFNVGVNVVGGGRVGDSEEDVFFYRAFVNPMRVSKHHPAGLF
jgi:hypothetical protein